MLSAMVFIVMKRRKKKLWLNFRIFPLPGGIRFCGYNVKGVDKASGIREFAFYYDFDISHTIAFGDGGNDISMLREAGIGVAMGGAAESIRAVSDYVTDTVDNDGIRNALIHFGFI